MPKVQQSLEQQFDLFNPYPQIENWKDIQGFEGKYQISSLGRVKSLARSSVMPNGGFNIIKEAILTDSPKRRYLSVSFPTGNNKNKRFNIHRLVAIAFIPNPENKDTVNHKNGDKHDNRVENLEWNTIKENIQHAFKNKLINASKGESHYRAKLTDFQILEIREKYSTGKYSKIALAKEYGLTQAPIWLIVTNKTWKHLSPANCDL